MTAIVTEEPICPIDVYDHMTQAREIFHWMEALAVSIKTANERDSRHTVKHLSELAQYLATDWAVFFDNQAESLAAKHGIIS